MAKRRDQVGELLQKWGIVDKQQLAEAKKMSDGTREKIGEVLVKLGYATENDVAKALASQLGMEYVDLDQPDVIDKSYISLIPEDIIRKYTIIPLGQDGSKIKVLVHAPLHSPARLAWRVRVRSQQVSKMQDVFVDATDGSSG